MSKERELLKRLLENFERPVTGRFGDLFDEVRELLSAPEPTQDEEPIGRVVQNASGQIYVEGQFGGAFDLTRYLGKNLYLHPAPRSEFVRLSEEEVTEILTSAYDMYAAICAVENRLVEKNSE